MFRPSCPSTCPLSAALFAVALTSPCAVLLRFVHFHKSTLATFAAAHASGTGLLPVPPPARSDCLKPFCALANVLKFASAAAAAAVSASASALHIKQFQFLAILFCSPCFIFFLSLSLAAFHCRRQRVAKAFRVADFDPETVFIVVALCFALVFCINFCVIKYSPLMLQDAVEEHSLVSQLAARPASCTWHPEGGGVVPRQGTA